MQKKGGNEAGKRETDNEKKKAQTLVLFWILVFVTNRCGEFARWVSNKCQKYKEKWKKRKINEKTKKHEKKCEREKKEKHVNKKEKK